MGNRITANLDYIDHPDCIYHAGETVNMRLRARCRDEIDLKRVEAKLEGKIHYSVDGNFNVPAIVGRRMPHVVRRHYRRFLDQETSDLKSSLHEHIASRFLDGHHENTFTLSFKLPSDVPSSTSQQHIPAILYHVIVKLYQPNQMTTYICRRFPLKVVARTFTVHQLFDEAPHYLDHPISVLVNTDDEHFVQFTLTKSVFNVPESMYLLVDLSPPSYDVASRSSHTDISTSSPQKCLRPHSVGYSLVRTIMIGRHEWKEVIHEGNLEFNSHHFSAKHIDHYIYTFSAITPPSHAFGAKYDKNRQRRVSCAMSSMEYASDDEDIVDTLSVNVSYDLVLVTALYNGNNKRVRSEKDKIRLVVLNDDESEIQMRKASDA